MVRTMAASIAEGGDRRLESRGCGPCRRFGHGCAARGPGPTREARLEGARRRAPRAGPVSSPHAETGIDLTVEIAAPAIRCSTRSSTPSCWRAGGRWSEPSWCRGCSGHSPCSGRPRRSPTGARHVGRHLSRHGARPAASQGGVIGECYWTPPEGASIGPMALTITCTPAAPSPGCAYSRQGSRRAALAALLRVHEQRAEGVPGRVAATAGVGARPTRSARGNGAIPAG